MKIDKVGRWKNSNGDIAIVTSLEPDSCFKWESGSRTISMFTLNHWMTDWYPSTTWTYLGPLEEVNGWRRVSGTACYPVNRTGIWKRRPIGCAGDRPSRFEFSSLAANHKPTILSDPASPYVSIFENDSWLMDKDYEWQYEGPCREEEKKEEPKKCSSRVEGSSTKFYITDEDGEESLATIVHQNGYTEWPMGSYLKGRSVEYLRTLATVITQVADLSESLKK